MKNERRGSALLYEFPISPDLAQLTAFVKLCAKLRARQLCLHSNQNFNCCTSDLIHTPRMIFLFLGENFDSFKSSEGYLNM